MVSLALLFSVTHYDMFQESVRGVEAQMPI